jgi:methylated-DNA-[protein]-cysteine S-methyltransferase
MAWRTGPGAAVFDTAIGRCGLAWTARGFDRLLLPAGGADSCAARLARAAPGRELRDPAPPVVAHTLERIRAHLGGRPAALGRVALDLRASSDFARRVYRRLRRVPPGQVISYGELARQLGAPGAARAVGSAMAANPVPLLVPCHRVLTGDRRLGGFSAAAGPALKARLLWLEGVVLDARHAAAMERVRRAAPALGPVIDRAGPFLPQLGPSPAAYDVLVESIVYQQLSMKAAGTIAGRLRRLGPGRGYPRPERLAGLDDMALRAVGLSRQKIGYLRDLAARVADGRLRPARLGRLDDAQVIATLTAVRGLGLWSVQMFLIFHLQRLDVWPVGDLGLRRAVARLSGLDADDRAAIAAWGDRFRPYRSVATWYLWRSTESGGLGP